MRCALPTQGALCPTERPATVSNPQPRGQASCKAASYWDSHTQGHTEVAAAPGVPPPCQTHWCERHVEEGIHSGAEERVSR